MAKWRKLNGIPHNITQRFFSTERYYNCGYMADWLLHAARKLNLTNASLDVLTATFEPADLNLHPLVFHAQSLRNIIDKELIVNGFDTGFIIEARINFQFLNPNIYWGGIYCFPYLIDKMGRRYESGQIIAEGLEPYFDPFDERNLYPVGVRKSD